MRLIQNTRFHNTLLIVLSLLTPGSRALANNEPDMPDKHPLSASEIDARMRDRSRGFDTLSARIHMRILAPDGERGTRELRIWMQEGDEQETDVLCVVTAPPDLRQTALLSQTVPRAPSRQWLFLPATQRVRRLAGGSRAGAFLGSDFSYADLTGGGIEGSDPELLRTETIENNQYYLLLYQAAGPDAVYGKQTVSICRQEFLVKKIDYEDARGRPLKTLWLEYGTEPETIRFGHARNMRMQNHRNGGQTLVEWREVNYGEELDERLFDYRMLSDVRFR